MFSKWQRAAFADILSSIHSIDEFLLGIDLRTYRTDRKTRLAVERLLQHLTEAAHRLGRDAATLCPDVDWRNLRALGNVLRHEYDQIDDEIIWQATQSELPTLKAAIQRVLAEQELHP